MMLRKTYLASIVLLAIFTISINLAHGKPIINGIVTAISKVPYIFELLHSGRPACGGSLISTTFGITAAHCFNFTTSNFEVFSIRLNSNTSDGGGNVLHLSNVFIYKEDEERVDIAVLKLAKPSGINEYAKLPQVNQFPQIGEYITVYGYGTISPIVVMDNHLKSVDLRVLSNASCRSVYSVLSRHEFCAYKPMRDACFGDSGGPAIGSKDGIQYGIVSWGVSCALLGYPGVYIQLSHPEIRGFIKQTANV